MSARPSKLLLAVPIVIVLAGAGLALGAVLSRGDVGRTIDVRIHGIDHATKPNTRISLILALLGVPMVLFGAYLLFTILSRSSTAITRGSAAS